MWWSGAGGSLPSVALPALAPCNEEDSKGSYILWPALPPSPAHTHYPSVINFLQQFSSCHLLAEKSTVAVFRLWKFKCWAWDSDSIIQAPLISTILPAWFCLSFISNTFGSRQARTLVVTTQATHVLTTTHIFFPVSLLSIPFPSSLPRKLGCQHGYRNKTFLCHSLLLELGNCYTLFVLLSSYYFHIIWFLNFTIVKGKEQEFYCPAPPWYSVKHRLLGSKLLSNVS